MQQRAADLGVHQVFQHEVESDEPFSDADLVIASDGVNSRTRQRHAAVFTPDIDVRKCRFIWLGTEQKFPAFTFAFERTEHGWFQIHAYQFNRDLSTMILKCVRRKASMLSSCRVSAISIRLGGRLRLTQAP